MILINNRHTILILIISIHSNRVLIQCRYGALKLPAALKHLHQKEKKGRNFTSRFFFRQTYLMKEFSDERVAI